MAKGVTFDYSKTSPFIRADEVELMKKLVGDAKEVSSAKREQAMISWAGLTSL